MFRPIVQGNGPVSNSCHSPQQHSSKSKGRRSQWYLFLLIATVGMLIHTQQRAAPFSSRYLGQGQDSLFLLETETTVKNSTTTNESGGDNTNDNVHSNTNTNNSSSSSNNNNNTKMNFFPPACSADQLETIQHQLPAELCIHQAKQPWNRGGQCSFSFATRCPDSVWLQEYFRQHHQRQQQKRASDNNNNNNNHQQQQQQQQQSLSPFTSIYVGCNKGMDAISTLRVGSANATYDKEIWRDTLFAGQPLSEVAAGHCGQEFGPQFDIQTGTVVNSNAVVHCIEPLPRNSNMLAATAEKLQIQDHFQVHAVAMSNRDGTAYFPADTKLGDEQKGIGSCDPKKNKKNNKACKAVPMYKLDTFMSHVLKEEEDKSSTPIDFLSIDVEGYDSLVLQGGVQTLLRTRYLEFEYNWKGPWAHTSLLTTIESLKAIGFACYWAGSHRNIWRITDCWLDHFDNKFWSNVACVNVQQDESSTRELADLMESMFEKTLQQGHGIQYKDFSSANTNGRKRTQ